MEDKTLPNFALFLHAYLIGKQQTKQNECSYGLSRGGAAA